MLGRLALPALAATLLGAAPAHAGDPAADGLVLDVERIVGAEESSGWFTDAEAYRSLRAAMLQSVCRATPRARQAARQVLAGRAEDASNPRLAFARAGGQLDAATERALGAERRLRALDEAIEAAGSECPFWVEPSESFQGRQTDRNRWSASLETGGMLQIRQYAGRWTYGGGGAGRLLAGYGFGGRFSLLAGPEFGGGAMLESGGSGGNSEFVINYFPAVPVVARWHSLAWHWDAEVAPVGWFQASDGSISYGGRAGFSLGVAALRTRGVIPWAGAALAYEHFLPSGGRDRAHFIRGGLRVGIVWDGD
jgi:hypothetical protein